MALESSRYNTGQVFYSHRNVVVNSTVGSPTFDKLTKYSGRLYQYDIGYIPAGFEHRPDLISDLFYNTPGYWWLLMLVNGVSDPYEGFNANDRILIPKI